MSIGTTVAAVGSLLHEGIVCRYKECCTKKEIPADFHSTVIAVLDLVCIVNLFVELEWLLRERVYGQQIAQEVILNALKAHWSASAPSSKALTLSFHGWPGGGKNYITGFIVEALYTLGYKSSHVHYFSSRIHFPEESKVSQYQALLYEWIKSNVTSCPKQLFIFDEVNKLPPKLLNMLKPIIDYNHNIQKVDYRESIFIFLSNTGESLIMEETLKLYKVGFERRDLALHHFDGIILRGAFNEEGGFHHSDTIKSNLIDHYVPFLPLEHNHIVECILDQFRLRQIYNPKKEHIHLPLCDEVDIFITPPDNDVQTDEDSGPEDSDGNINNLNSRQLAAQAEKVCSFDNIIATSCEELKDKKKRTWIDGDLEAPKTAAFKEFNYDKYAAMSPVQQFQER
ncbi:hypothetical protein FQA39_LY00441 [Lamprigera yunnana]|nr:hypothetical protein FQA39_LY00441 [Lamprigera yunnana]